MPIELQWIIGLFVAVFGGVMAIRSEIVHTQREKDYYDNMTPEEEARLDREAARADGDGGLYDQQMEQAYRDLYGPNHASMSDADKSRKAKEFLENNHIDGIGIGDKDLDIPLATKAEEPDNVIPFKKKRENWWEYMN